MNTGGYHRYLIFTLLNILLYDSRIFYHFLSYLWLKLWYMNSSTIFYRINMIYVLRQWNLHKSKLHRFIQVLNTHPCSGSFVKALTGKAKSTKRMFMTHVWLLVAYMFTQRCANRIHNWYLFTLVAHLAAHPVRCLAIFRFGLTLAKYSWRTRETFLCTYLCTHRERERMRERERLILSDT